MTILKNLGKCFAKYTNDDVGPLTALHHIHPPPPFPFVVVAITKYHHPYPHWCRNSLQCLLSWPFLLFQRHVSAMLIFVSFAALVASQWLGLFLQFIGVAMVTAVAFIAVLEHHFSTVDPGKYLKTKRKQTR